MTIAESIAKEAALTPDEIVDAMQGLGKRARAASAELALASAEIKNTALRAAEIGRAFV